VLTRDKKENEMKNEFLRRDSIDTFVFSDTYHYRTANVGQMVKFPCPTKLDQDIDWARLNTLKSESKYIYRSHLGMNVDWRDRFTVKDKNHSHTLVIRNVTVNDSAYYQCVEDSGFGNRHFYILTVKGDFLFFFN